MTAGPTIASVVTLIDRLARKVAQLEGELDALRAQFSHQSLVHAVAALTDDELSVILAEAGRL